MTATQHQLARATAALLQADPDLRRDWYGHELSIDKLEAFARYVLEQAQLPMDDLVNQVALAMLTYDIPMIAEAIEEQADDEHIETLVRIVLDAAYAREVST